METDFRAILEKLTSGDNVQLFQAAGELKEALKKPQAVDALIAILLDRNTAPGVRQYAAVVLRKKYEKKKSWKTVKDKSKFKSIILQCLLSEGDAGVRTAVMQLVGCISKHEGSWSGLFQTIQQCVQSADPAQSQFGLTLLKCVADHSAAQLQSHYKAILRLLDGVIGTPGNVYYCLTTLDKLIPYMDSTHVSPMQAFMGKIFEPLWELCQQDPAKAAECFEIFDDLIESELTILTPHKHKYLEFCFHLITKEDLDIDLKVKAISSLGWMIRYKKKVFLKLKLIDPTLKILFPIICGDFDDCDYWNLESEEASPYTAAAQTFDLMAINFPPEKLINAMLPHVQAGLTSSEPNARRGACLTLGLVAEGCSDYITTHHMDQFLEWILNGIKDPHPSVQTTAFFSLGQFSEYLQPKITEYSAQILPVLFEFLTHICSSVLEQKDIPGIDRIFYAMESYFENLEEGLLPHLPLLMERLFALLDPHLPVHVRELALSAIGATTNAVKDKILPYSTRILEILTTYLNMPTSDEILPLQTQSFDTLGVMARSLGAEHFGSLSEECMAFAVNMINTRDDPDVKKCIYSLFASLSIVMEDKMEAYLPVVLKKMVLSLNDTQDIVNLTKAEDTLDIFSLSDGEEDDEIDLESESDEEDSDDEDIAGITVENSFLEEKEEACLAIKEIVVNVKAAFVPYLASTMAAVSKLIDHPHEDIRKAGMETFAQLLIAQYQCCTTHNIPEDQIKQTLMGFMPRLGEMVKTDEVHNIVISALDTIAELLVGMGPLMFPLYKQLIMDCVYSVMAGKVTCLSGEHDTGAHGDEEDDEDEAEQDILVVQYAGDIVPKLAAVVPPEEFVGDFRHLLPLFLQRTKKHSTAAEKSFSIGTLAEVISVIKEAANQFVDILPVFLHFANDKDDEVRSNAIYGVGEISSCASRTLAEQYPSVLNTLSATLAHEKCPRVMDNICGAVARMIVANSEAMPLSQIFSRWILCLPLREDFEENEYVFKCLLFLYKKGFEDILPHLPNIFKLGLSVYESKESCADADPIIAELVKCINNDFADEISKISGDLTDEMKTKLTEIVK